MDRRLDDYDATIYGESDRRYIGWEEKSQSGWDQLPATVSRNYSEPTSECTFGRQQSGIAKNYFGVTHYERENSSADLESDDQATKLLVSNVHFKVTDADVLELFGEFRSLKFSRVNYNRSGRPLGSAELVFGKRADAMKAIELYNGAKLDGRKLSIQVATPEVLATDQFKNAVKFIPTFRKSKIYNEQSKFRGGMVTKSYKQGKKPRRTTVEELDAELDRMVEDRQNN